MRALPETAWRNGQCARSAMAEHAVGYFFAALAAPTLTHPPLAFDW